MMHFMIYHRRANDAETVIYETAAAAVYFDRHADQPLLLVCILVCCTAHVVRFVMLAVECLSVHLKSTFLTCPLNNAVPIATESNVFS